MSSVQSELERQVWDLTKRVFEIERRIGVRGAEATGTVVPPPVAVPVVPEVASVEVVPPAKSAVVASLFGGRPQIPLVAPRVGAAPEVEGPAGGAAGAARRPLAEVVEAARARMGRPPTEVGPGTHSLESWVGGKLFAALGAVVLVIGVGLGLKLGVDRGWFTFSPLVRCLGAGALGAALLGLGQLARKRWGVMASVGLSGAGIATMFVSVLAAYGWYELVSTPVAFVMLVGVSAVGIGVSLASSSLAIAALSMVCAYATPLLLGDSRGPAAVVPVYLMALLGLGLGLSAWRPGVFRALRTLAWWGTVVVGTIWLLTVGHNHPIGALAFLGLVWLAVHGELVFGATRLSEEAPTAMGPKAMSARALRPIAGSLSTTAWAVGMGIGILQFASNPAMPTWLVACAGAVGTLALGMVLAGTLRAMQDKPETDLQRLGAALRVQGGGLMVVAMALALSGSAMTLAWLAMGLAAVVAGRWLRMRGLDVYGVVVLGLATARMIVWDSWQGAGTTVTAMGLVLSQWSLLMVLGGAAWLVAVTVMCRGRELLKGWALAAGLGVWVSAVCFMGSLLVQGTNSKAVVLAWAVVSMGYAAGARLRRGIGLEWVAGVATAATSLAWAGVFLVNSSWLGHPGAAMAHPGFWIGLVIVAAWILLPLLAATPDAATRSVMRAIGGGLLLVASSFEVARSAQVLVPGDTTVHRAAVSVWWAVFGVGLIVVGFARRIPAVRHAGLALMSLATLKGVLFDLADVSAEWRVVTFLGLGVLMLGVAVAYARASARAAREGTPGAA